MPVRADIESSDWQIAVINENNRAIRGLCVSREEVASEVANLLPLVEQRPAKPQLSTEEWAKDLGAKLAGNPPA